MLRGEQNDELVERIRELRTEIRAKVEAELLEEYEAGRSEDRFPWEGLWLTRGQIAAVIKKLKIRDKIVFFEILALFFVLLLFSLMGFRALIVLLLPA